MTGWGKDQGRRVKENESEMEDIKIFQEKLICKLLEKFVSLEEGD